MRGLDYYTKTAFEIKYEPLGAQSAVAGGGRYDGLVEEMGGAATPAVGFACGLERVMLAIETQRLYEQKESAADVFVVALGEAAQKAAFEFVMELREKGLIAVMDYGGRSMKSQMKQANKSEARFAAIMGDDELKENVVMLRDMKSSEQEKVPRDEVTDKILGGCEHGDSCLR